MSDGGFSCSGSDASQKDAEAASSNDEPGSAAGDLSAEDKSGQSASGIKHADLFQYAVAFTTRVAFGLTEEEQE